MGRVASPETQLRAANKRIRELDKLLLDMRESRDQYRARSTRAEQETAEWKFRFDRLLERTPKTNSGTGENHG